MVTIAQEYVRGEGKDRKSEVFKAFLLSLRIGGTQIMTMRHSKIFLKFNISSSQNQELNVGWGWGETIK